MKKVIFLAGCLYCLLQAAPAQQAASPVKPNLKYGKPSNEELAMDAYPPDSAATAVVLFHTGKTNFKYTQDFKLATEHFVRIKVLKPEGRRYADITIPYYAPAGKEANDEEGIFSVSACAYNLEGQKCVKTPMKQEFVVKERINDNTCVVKFTVPAVKAGTVIEYKYTLLSDYYEQIDNWEMQEDIPVVHNQYEIVIPNLLIYAIELRGKSYIRTQEKSSSVNITYKTGGGRTQVAHDMSIQARKIVFTAQDLPALKKQEAYCWYPADYKVQVCFELEGLNYPDEDYRPIAKEWKDIDKILLKPDDEAFGKQLQLENPLREEMKKLSWENLSFDEKISQAFHLLKERVAWDGNYRLQSKSPLQALAQKTGSNADINFLFISMLKDLAIKAYPSVLRSRDLGVLPVSFPSLQKLNTFIVAVEDPKGKYVFFDGSMNVPVANVLPPVLLVDKTRIIGPQPEEQKWADLTASTHNTSHLLIDVRMEDDARMNGHCSAAYTGQAAADFRRRYAGAADSSAFVGRLEEQQKCRISGYRQEGAETARNKIREEYDFTCGAETGDNLIYINPMLFPHLIENPFTQAKRELPVEFDYPYSYSMNVTLTLPEGYRVEELPASKSIVTDNEGIACKYLIRQAGQQINLRYTFTVKQMFFPAEQYLQLQTVWKEALEKNNSLIVLKKI